MADRVARNEVPFAGDSPMIYILKVHRPEKLLNVDTYDESQFAVDQAKLEDMFGKEVVAKEMKNLLGYEPGTKIVYMTNNLTKNPHEWSTTLRKLGYVGIYDPGLQVVHNNEPTQVVVFGPDQFEIVDQINNKPLDVDWMDKLARSPKTDRKTLARLANEDDDIKYLVAAHPNASEQTLRNLFALKPGPWMAMALLKNPNLPIDMFDSCIATIKNNENYLREVIKDLTSKAHIERLLQSSDPNLIQWLAANPNISTETLVAILQQYPDAQENLVYRKDIPDDDLYAKIWPYLNKNAKFALSRKDNFPIELMPEIVELAQNYGNLYGLLGDNRTPPEVLLSIVRKFGNTFSILDDVLEHFNVKSILPQIVAMNNPVFSANIANSHLTPPSILDLLVQQGDAKLAYLVSSNKNASATTLKRILELPDDGSENMKYAQAQAKKQLLAKGSLAENSFFTRY
jgi:hypothetical protein